MADIRFEQVSKAYADGHNPPDRVLVGIDV